MKILSKVIPLVLSLSLLMACSEDGDDTINVTVVEDKNLDNNLIGVWSRYDPDGNPNYRYISFSSNGQYSQWLEYTGPNIFGVSALDAGEWWASGGWLFLINRDSRNGSNQGPVIIDYTVYTDSLRFEGGAVDGVYFR